MEEKKLIVDKVNPEWHDISPKHLWYYNKLILSRTLGYDCGPTGVMVSKPGFFIVRPCMNYLGMGRNARILYLNNSTDFLHPGEFWCEVFYGTHYSVDFQWGVPKLIVRGIRNLKNPLYKWEQWEKLTKEEMQKEYVPYEIPSILKPILKDFKWINCEFIEKKLIEVHFRRNPDFRFGNDVAIPVWKNEKTKRKHRNMKFVKDEDYLREGFWIGKNN